MYPLAIDKKFSTLIEVQTFCYLLELNADIYRLLSTPDRAFSGLLTCIIGEIDNTLVA